MRPGSSPYDSLTVYLLALCTVLADQFAKAGVVAALPLGQSHPVVPGWLHLTYVQNFGAAFSLLWGKGILLSGVAVLVVLGVVGYQWIARPRDLRVVLSLGLLLGGAVGNLIDRVALGYVRDMVDVRVAGQNVWPIFNLADMAIMLSAGLMILHALTEGRSRSARENFRSF